MFPQPYTAFSGIYQGNLKNYLDYHSRLVTTSTYLICLVPKEMVKTLSIWLIYTLKISLKNTRSKIEF